MAALAELPPPPIVGHVKTTFQEPDDICHSCEKFWTDKGKTPRIMVELPIRGDYGTRIFVCPWCCPPDAPVWMGDLNFKPLGEIQVGDEVIGWKVGSDYVDQRPSRTIKASQSPRHHLCRTTVEAISMHHAPLQTVVMESNREFICTPDHLWWGHQMRSKKINWVTADLGQSLRYVAAPPTFQLTPEQIYAAGYIAGIYDGEGGDLRMHQHTDVNPETCQRIQEMLDRVEVSYTQTLDYQGHADFTLTGGRAGYLDFLWKIQPAKRESLIAHILTSRFTTPDRVVAVEPLASGDVIGLRTGTGNYVVNGYASRNCDGPVAERASSGT